MIRYALRCSEGHGFESWFQSAAGFDGLQGAGHLTCPVCGRADVVKAVMAPAVATDNARLSAAPRPDAGRAEGAGADPDRAAALEKLRRHIEDNSEYVGLEFVSEARRIHAGDAPERAIYGEARPDEARRLIEEGVPVAPLPFIPQRRVN